jgi:acyl carrier protein
MAVLHLPELYSSSRAAYNDAYRCGRIHKVEALPPKWLALLKAVAIVALRGMFGNRIARALHLEISEITRNVISILAKYSVQELADISETSSIFGVGGVITDSIKILDALCDIETFFGVSIPDEDLTEELFSSVSSLVSYLSSKSNANSQ